jgi:hypothetical protein
MAIAAGLAFTCVWFLLEFEGRQRAARAPRDLRELYAMSSKAGAARLGVDPRAPALIFATASYFCFALWESALGALVDHRVSPVIFVVGLALAGGALYFRKRQLRVPAHAALTREDLVLLLLSWSALFGAGFTTVLLPWVMWRGRFLSRAPSPRRA